MPPTSDIKPPAKQGYVVLFNESEAQKALLDARGDIFVASQMLGVTAIRLNRAIQLSVVLAATMDQLIADGRKTDPHIHQAIEERVSLYRVAGLDALHELATMPLNDNSAQNQVKLAAAARLAGSIGGDQSSDMGDVFRELREAYEQQAPRLRVIREKTTTTVEVVPQPAERVVASQEKSD